MNFYLITKIIIQKIFHFFITSFLPSIHLAINNLTVRPTILMSIHSPSRYMPPTFSSCHLFIYQSNSNQRSVHLSIYTSVHLPSIHPSLPPLLPSSIHPSIHPSIHSFINIITSHSIHPSIYPSIDTSIYPSTHPSSINTITSHPFHLSIYH